MATFEIEAVYPSEEKLTTKGNCFAENKQNDSKIRFFLTKKINLKFFELVCFYKRQQIRIFWSKHFYMI